MNHGDHGEHGEEPRRDKEPKGLKRSTIVDVLGDKTAFAEAIQCAKQITAAAFAEAEEVSRRELLAEGERIREQAKKDVAAFNSGRRTGTRRVNAEKLAAKIERIHEQERQDVAEMERRCALKLYTLPIFNSWLIGISVFLWSMACVIGFATLSCSYRWEAWLILPVPMLGYVYLAAGWPKVRL